MLAARLPRHMPSARNRRDFVRITAGSAGAIALASCAEETAPPPPAQASNASLTNPRPPADVLPRVGFLDFLDVTADTTMRRCHHCAQATFVSLQEGFGLEGGTIVKALTPLPGIAERGETCGAVIGALMALGLVFGRDRIDDWGAWRASLGPARAFCARFEQAMGSTQCGALLGRLFGKRYDLADPAQLAEFQAARPGPVEVCARVVKTAVRLAAEVILDERSR